MSTRLFEAPVVRGLIQFPGHLARFLAIIAASFTIVAALLLTAEVVSRAFFGQPIRGLFEYMQLLVVLIAFLGLAEAERNGDHIRVTLLTERLPRKVTAAVRVFAMLVSGLIVLWMSVMSFLELQKSLGRGEYSPGLLNLPVWPARIIIVVGLTALFLMYVTRTIETIIELKQSFGDPVDGDVDVAREGGEE